MSYIAGVSMKGRCSVAKFTAAEWSNMRRTDYQKKNHELEMRLADA
jgi:hypothetical protein